MATKTANVQMHGSSARTWPRPSLTPQPFTTTPPQEKLLESTVDMMFDITCMATKTANVQTLGCI
eukprot:4459565-Amphidinium_carterae.1